MEDVQHTFSLTISPLHLLFPIVELTGELRLGDKLGVAGVAGGGITPSGSDSFPTFEVGGQVRYYVIGSFIHGLQLGAELLLVALSGDVGGASAKGLAVSASPFIGYKIASNVGFTFEAQLGPSFMAVGAVATLGSSRASASDQSISLLLNLNIGWSFGG